MPDDADAVLFGMRDAQRIDRAVNWVERQNVVTLGTTQRRQIYTPQWNAGGNNTATRIRFQIVSAQPSTFSVYGEVHSWDAGLTYAAVPGDLNTILGISPPLGVVQICDPTGCFFDAPQDELFGREGFAIYQTGLDPSACSNQSGYPPYTYWEVISLCCPLPSCNF